MKIQSRTVSTLVAALLVFALAGCGKSPEEHMQQAQAFLKKSDYKAAVLELKNVLQEQPENGAARFLLGQAYMATNAYADAEKELSRAQSLGVKDPQLLPTLAKAFHKLSQADKLLALEVSENGLDPKARATMLALRAEALLAQGKQSEAEQELNAAAKLDAANPDLLLVQARVSIARKQLPQALEFVETALRSDAKLLDALYLKAELLNRENKPDDAGKIYRHILTLDDRQFLAHLALAQQAMARGDLVVAEKEIQSAEKVVGKSPLVKYARGIFELRRGRNKEASDALQQVLSVSSDHLPSILALAVANYGLGNFEQSLLGARRVHAQLPDNPIAAHVTAASMLKMGDPKGALDILLPILKSHGNDVRLLSQVGTAYLQLREFSKAMEFLDRAATLDPGNPTIKTQRIAGRLARGETEQALVELEQVTRLTDTVGRADFALVVLHLRRKEYDLALQALAELEKKQPNNPVTHNLRAAALLGKQDRAGARKALQKALSIDPSFYAAAVNLARMDMQDKNPEAARGVFESVLVKDKNNLQAMLALADLAAANKQEDDFVAWMEKAKKAHPESIQPRVALTRYYMGKKDSKKALAIAKEASQANPDSSEALGLLGATQLAANEKASAIETYTRLVDKDKLSPEAHLQLAMAQGVNGQVAEARASLKRALQLKPDHQPSLDALIQLELSDHKPDAALSVARDLQRLAPRSALGFEREGDIQMSQQQHARAVKPYQQAIDKGASTQGMLKLHAAMSRAGDIKSAQAKLDGWLKMHPEDLAARAYAASQAMQQGQDKAAIAQFEEILRLRPAEAVVMNNLANLYQRNKDPRALGMAEKAYKLLPQHPAVLDTLGWILLEQGQVAKGRDLLEKAAGQADKNMTIQYHYAVALLRSGDKAKAGAVLRRVLANPIKFPEEAAARSLLESLK